MDVAGYRAFQERAPDTERWELIAGVPVRVPLQTILHSRMVSDLAVALNGRLQEARADKMALQRIEVDIASTDAIEAAQGFSGRCVPAPDVIVMDRAYHPDAWLASRAYLVGEVVGDDHDRLPVGDGTWSDVKISMYMAHNPCCAIVIVDQRRHDLTLHVRGDDGWDSQVLHHGDELSVPGLGISLPVSAIRGWRPASLRRGAPELSAMAWAVLRCWDGRPEARLSMVGDVAVPVSRSTNRNPLEPINELLRAGLIVNEGGVTLTDAGRALIAGNGTAPVVEVPPCPGAR